MKTLDAYRDVRVLVLGGGGFIGSWTAATLKRRGADVVVAARDVARAQATLSRHGVRCEVRAYDLTRSDEVSSVLRAVKPTVTFNLAGYGVDPSERDEALSERLNHELVAELAEQVAPDSHWRGQALVHVGSALEFGAVSGDLGQPWNCSPTTLYGRTKLAGSRALHDITLRRGVKAVVARLFTIYGPGEHSTRLVPTLLAARATSNKLPLTAGEQTRDFTYVLDIAHGLMRLGIAHEAVPERALNLATGVLTPVRQFIETAAGMFGIAPQRLEFGALPTRPEEMSHDPVSTAMCERALVWKPSTTIVQGLRETFAFERCDDED